MGSRDSETCSIFHIPNEILAEILLYLNARERVAFANISERFHSIVFGDKVLLSDLDFSEEGRLTLMSDIEEYFRDEETSKHVLKINLTNVRCIPSSEILKDILRRGNNLVDVNVQRLEFKNIPELRSFLEPLEHLERLSIDWPKTTKEDSPICREHLAIPFSKLIYLAVRFSRTNYSTEFITALHLCKKLEEVHIVQLHLTAYDYEIIWDIGQGPLENLKIIQYCGYGAMEVMNHVGLLLAEPKAWRYFPISPYTTFNGFYYAKNVEYCELLSQSHYDLRRYPLHTNAVLLQIIIRAYETWRDDLCCLAIKSYGNENLPCLMKMDEFKNLLKDPDYKISYLKIGHSIESYCTAHLLGSLFPTLTELVLGNIVKGQSSVPVHSKKRLKKIGAPDADDDSNINNDPCFKMLVGNTPNLRSFTVKAEMSLPRDWQEWDLEALREVGGWKNLRILRLKFVPITNGDFLIEIGRKCSLLEQIQLQSIGPWDECHFINELGAMVRHCENLKSLTLCQNNLHQVSEFLRVLALNKKLEKIIIRCRGRDETIEDLISASEYILEQCQRLNSFYCIVDALGKANSEKLASALRRKRVELNRPTLQFQVLENRTTQDLVVEDYVPPSFPWNLDRFDLL